MPLVYYQVVYLSARVFILYDYPGPKILYAIRFNRFTQWAIVHILPPRIALGLRGLQPHVLLLN